MSSTYGWYHWDSFLFVWPIAHEGYIPRPIGEFDESWVFKAPKGVPSGPDPDGWGDFTVGYVFRSGKRFLAYPLGARWKHISGEWQRTWQPTAKWYGDLAAAMVHCEEEFLGLGSVLRIHMEHISETRQAMCSAPLQCGLNQRLP
jgi:hypothetical protein